MKRNPKILVVLLLMAVASCSFTTKSFDDPDKDKVLIDLITYVLNQGHYDAKDEYAKPLSGEPFIINR